MQILPSHVPTDNYLEGVLSNIGTRYRTGFNYTCNKPYPEHAGDYPIGHTDYSPSESLCDELLYHPN